MPRGKLRPRLDEKGAPWLASSFWEAAAAARTENNRDISIVPFNTVDICRPCERQRAGKARHVTVSYHPESARGICWNDPALGIPWPLPDLRKNLGPKTATGLKAH